MKECKDCEFCCGFDYEDGTPFCEVDGGYESCPFNDYAETKPSINNTKIEIDVSFFTDYIKHTLQNTFDKTATEIAEREIKAIVEKNYNEIIKSLTEEYVRKCVEKSVNDFMKDTMTIGGDWLEPPRTVTREQYISELARKELQKLSSNTIEVVKKVAQETINDFTRKAKNDINKEISKTFNETMRTALTDNVVSMLMANETFARMANSMDRLLK